MIKTTPRKFPFLLSQLLRCSASDLLMPGNWLNTVIGHSQLRRLAVNKIQRKLPTPANFSSKSNKMEESESSQGKSCRIVFISDTHSVHEKLGCLPAGDVLIHAGDFSMARPAKPGEYTEFFDWFVGQPHQHKILISGNRDQLMDSAAKVRFVERRRL